MFGVGTQGFEQIVRKLLSSKGGGRRVVETIWNVGAGDPSSRPVRNANLGNPLKVD